MSRRADRPDARARSASLNTPFRGLAKKLPQRPAAAPAPAPTRAATPPSPPSDDGTLFRHAMDGVRPLVDRERVERAAPASAPRVPVSEEDEALAALSDLVSGTRGFDIAETREYVEGHVVGLDPRLVRKLRRGEFAWQAHLDLHGMTAAPARAAVERFVLDAVRTGLRCVLIVHGRGLNSKDQVPVLKERMKSWLARGRIARAVLAFASARPHDGGAGALYVLLRRDRRARPMRVTEGSAQ